MTTINNEPRPDEERPWKEPLVEGDSVFLIHNFLTPKECEELIALSESKGYADAPITTGPNSFAMVKEIRNNDRVMIDDVAMANLLFDRAKPFLPETWFGWELEGLNERFRYYRYKPGQKFARHSDGCFQRDHGERSHLTFMIYLNEGCVGGETTIYHIQGRDLHIVPEVGKVLVFAHKLLHEGTEVLDGVKYVIRSDVMYRR